MIRLVVVSALLAAVALCDHHDTDYETDYGRDDGDMLRLAIKELTKDGYTPEEIKEYIDQSEKEATEEEDKWQEGEETYFSWTESKGYSDCDEFIPEKYRNKARAGTKKGGRHHKKPGQYDQKKWDDDKSSNWGKEESRNEIINDSEENMVDNSFAADEVRSFSHHQKAGKHHKKCHKPLPIEVLCARHECPPAKRMNSTGCGYETRLVYAAKWVATDLEDITDIEGSIKSAFWRLFKYISGHNNANQKIEMTVPIIYKWFLDENYNVTSARMHFYIPAQFQDAPPLPNDDSVEIDEFVDSVMYDRAWGGDDAAAKYTTEAEKLALALGKAGITPYYGFTMSAEYTRPGYGRQRHEVIFLDPSW